MHFTSLLALTTSLSLAAAAPTTQAARAVGTWTLRNYVRVCDDAKNACTYSFTVADNNSGRTDDCNFTDQADASRSARWSSPSNLACSPGSPIYVNIGYDAPGNFFVVVPVNTETNLNAFFGYTAAEMADGNVVTPDHTSDSLVIGTWELAKAKGGAAVKARDAADLGQWTVEKLHRTCQTDTTATCSYNFQINQNDGSALANCDLVIEGPPTQSFYTKPCQNMPQWLISWGYNAEFGYAVMTVVSQPKQVDAFFGFNDVNTNVDFPNVGPNPVYHL